MVDEGSIQRVDDIATQRTRWRSNRSRVDAGLVSHRIGQMSHARNARDRQQTDVGQRSGHQHSSPVTSDAVGVTRDTQLRNNKCRIGINNQITMQKELYENTLRPWLLGH